MKKYQKIILALAMLAMANGCKKLAEVEAPLNGLTRETVFASNSTAISFVNGIYTSFPQDLPIYTGLSADELRVTELQSNTTVLAVYKNDLTPTNNFSFWSGMYPLVYRCNTAEENLNITSTLSPVVRQQLLGEVKFLRAFIYFHLVNFYGNVPLVLTTDYKTNVSITRTDRQAVYQQIIKDLKEAQSLLADKYLGNTLLAASADRVRPTSWAATALLARVYLYTNDNANAEIQSTNLIQNSALFSLPAPNGAFLKASQETIFALQPTASLTANTVEGQYFVLPPSGPVNYFGPWAAYLNAPQLSSFEPGDLRRSNWVSSVTVSGSTYYFAYKYKLGEGSTPGSEYSVQLRLGEQYLIRAEARIRQGGGKIADGIADLNVLRSRARDMVTVLVPNPLPPLSTSLTQESALNAVFHERQVELFTEGGHRWFDLKRSAKIDEVMTNVSSLKGTIWESHQQLYPVPASEIRLNPLLAGQQNPGYN